MQGRSTLTPAGQPAYYRVVAVDAAGDESLAEDGDASFVLAPRRLEGGGMGLVLPVVVIVLAGLLGFGSLAAFGAYCFAGSRSVVSLGLTDTWALVFDAALCLVFFTQHSVMIRRSFRGSLARAIAEAYHGAVYAMSSGVVLFLVLLLWQGTAEPLVSVDGPWRWFMRLTFAAALAGFGWGAMALRTFDPLGAGAVLGRARERPPQQRMPLAVRGPYRYVRHPMYLFFLVIIWSSPVITADRLLFNVLWSIWILVGTLLEERDLLADFGPTYLRYRQDAPMIIPWRLINPSRSDA